MGREEGRIWIGMLVCWLLNLVELGIAFLILTMAGDRALPTVFVLVGGIGLIQISYVVPLYRILRRSGKPQTATGMLIAASVTFLLNAACDFGTFGRTIWR